MWAQLLPYAAPSGAVAILSAAVMMLLTGRLVPLRTHERELKNKQDEIDRLQAALTKVEGQRDRLLGLAEVTVGVMQALPKALPTAPAAKDPVS